MKILDYGRSFIQSTGEGTRNSPRFWVESCTRIVDETTGATEDFHQCGACKAETIFVDTGIFSSDNHDFTPIFGPEYNLIFRRKAYLNAGYRTVTPAGDPWVLETRTRQAASPRLLETDAAVIEATYANLPIVVQVEIANETLGLRGIVECPVKTMNIDAAQGRFQVDTGPVVWPDLSLRHDRLVDSLSLAFIVFNASAYVETVTEVPTELGIEGAGATRVHHFSEIQSHESTNRVYCVGEG